MSVVSNANSRAEAEIASGPDVFSVLVEDGAKSALMGTLYSVLLPQDAARFRVRVGADGFFDVMFKLRGRWRRVYAAWRQLKGRDLDPAEYRPVAVVSFARKALKRCGAGERKPKQ